MKLPAIFYGPPGRTATRVRKLAKAVVAQGNFADYDPGPFIDTADCSGLVFVDEESWQTDAENFHCYLLSRALASASPQSAIRDNVHAWLMGSLETEWRFMCTLGGESWLGLDGRDPEYALRYVHAAVKHWPTMSAENHRFGPPLDDKNDVLLFWITLFYALRMLGVSAVDRLQVPGRTPKEFLELIERRGKPST